MTAIYRSEAGEREILGRYEKALDAWPIPAARMRVPTREGETFVLACGPANAPPLVLLHGSGANATTWWNDIACWSRHFRTYAVDLVGEPGLSAPSRPSLASGACARWLGAEPDGSRHAGGPRDAGLRAADLRPFPAAHGAPAAVR